MACPGPGFLRVRRVLAYPSATPYMLPTLRLYLYGVGEDDDGTCARVAKVSGAKYLAPGRALADEFEDIPYSP